MTWLVWPLIAAGALAAAAALAKRLSPALSLRTLILLSLPGVALVAIWRTPLPVWAKFLLGLPLVFVTAAGKESWETDRAVDQAERDRLAARISDDLAASEWSGEDFVLYLRSFATTDRLGAQPMETPGFDQPQHLDLETLFQRALAPRPLVALGRPGEMYGAGRVATPDEEWQVRFIPLAREARFILLIPSPHEGTLWETSWLRDNGLMQKVVVIMPPDPAAVRSRVIWVTQEGPEPLLSGPASADHDLDHRAEWQAVAKTARSLGIILPDYDERGALLMLDDEGVVRRRATLDTVNTPRRIRRVRAALRSVLAT